MLNTHLNKENLTILNPKIKNRLITNIKGSLKIPFQLYLRKKYKQSAKKGKHIEIPFAVKLLIATKARSFKRRTIKLYQINLSISANEKTSQTKSELQNKVALEILGEAADNFLWTRPNAKRLLPWDGNIDIVKAKAYLPELENLQRFAKRNTSNRIIDVIIPVYGQRNETLSCIYSVLNSVNKTEFEIIVIEDCGNDDELRMDLKRLAKLSLITLHLNETNLGFVKSVNFGMDMHQDRDVILLNSDTNVYADWIDRMLQHTSDESVATITPLSNSATICSYPNFIKDYDHNFDISDETLDKLSSTINPESVEVPSGVGFCMFIRRKCIQDVGNFDADLFGKGYGEENDFCQRAIRKGWKNVAIGNVFVRHYGGSSFGKEKAELCHNAQILLNKKHPNYTDDLIKFIDQDPMAKFRNNLDLQRFGYYIANYSKRVLIITLDLGGGTEKHVNDLAANLLEENIYPILLKCRAGKLYFEQKNSAIFPNLKGIDLSESRKELDNILKILSIDFVHIHHLLGIGQKSIDSITNSLKQNKYSYFVTIHDYFSVCSRVTLINKSGIYCNEPTENECNICAKGTEARISIESINDWRKSWEKLLQNAKGVFVPNIDVSLRLTKYFKEVNFLVRPHDIQIIKSKKEKESKLKTFAIIGAIGPHKGSDILHDLALYALSKKSDIKFIVMGDTNKNSKFKSLKNVTITGPYDDSDGLNTLEKLKCDAALYLSVWPETFSYTLSMAFQAGLYPISFDLGAQGQRIREIGIGTLLNPILMKNTAALYTALTSIENITEFQVENQQGYLSFKDYYQE
ncbi:MAG: glycosyltransferase [Flavobacterium sp.]